MFRRKNNNNTPATLAPGDAIDAHRVDDVEPSIDQFLNQYAALLSDSANGWQVLPNGFKDFMLKEEDSIARTFNEGVQECFRQSGIPQPPEGSVDRESSRLLDALPAFMHAVTQRNVHDLDPDTGFRGMARFTKNIKTLGGIGFAHIITRKSFPLAKLLLECSSTAGNIKYLQGIDSQILNGLCAELLKKPENVDDLLTLYDDGGTDVYPLLVELQKIIAADWHNPNQEESILRRHAESLTSDPSMHIVNFCEAVGRGEYSDSAAAMATYALVSSELAVDGESIAKHLHTSANRWSQVPDLQDEFNGYVAYVAKKVEQMFSSIAGLKNDAPARNKPTDEEFEAMNRVMCVYTPASAKDKRRTSRLIGQHTISAGLGSDKKSPSNTTEQDTSKPRQLVRLSYVNGRGWEVASKEGNGFSAEEIVTECGIQKGQDGLFDDMTMVVSYLQDPTKFFPGSKKMQSASASVTLGGKRRGLWRFAPDQEPGLSIKPNNRFHRIVYAVVDGKVAIVDILSHPDFDKKYPTG